MLKEGAPRRQRRGHHPQGAEVHAAQRLTPAAKHAHVDSKAGNRSRKAWPLVLGAIGVVFGDIGTSPLYTMKEAFGHEVRPAARPGQRARRAVAGVLVDDAGRHGQVRDGDHARRQPRRRRHPGADGGGAAQPADRLAAGLRRRHPRHLRHRAVLRRRRDHAGDLGAVGGRGPGGRRAGAAALHRAGHAGGAGGAVLVPAPRHRARGQAVRAGDGAVVRRASAVLGGWHSCCRTPRCCARSIRSGRSQFFLAPRRGMPGWRWARWCWRSPAARRCTPTWATSAACRSASPGLWFVLPALLLNYFGQGALLLADPAAVENPFYSWCRRGACIPMIVLATLAAVIASQAVISGAFSLARQAIQLGYLPRLKLVHTSGETIGQVYMPWVNRMLLVVGDAAGGRLRLLERAGVGLRRVGDRHHADRHHPADHPGRHALAHAGAGCLAGRRCCSSSSTCALLQRQRGQVPRRAPGSRWRWAWSCSP